MPYLLFAGLHRTDTIGYCSLKEAKNLGFDVILLGKKLPRYANPLIANFYEIDVHDVEITLDTVKNLAKKYSIHGVPCWAETDVITVSHIANQLKLPGLELDAAIRSRSKYEMRKALSKNHAEIIPQFQKVTNEKELLTAIDKIGFPSILKPVGGAGSKGIFKLQNTEDAYRALSLLKNIASINASDLFHNFEHEYIMEEFFEGSEISVDGFVQDNVVKIIGITDKWGTDDYFLEYKIIFPTNKSSEIKEIIYKNTKNIINSLRINNCAFHLEAKVSENSFKFIEIAARPAALYLTSHAIPSSTGINFFKNHILLSVGDVLDLTPCKNNHSGIQWFLPKSEGLFGGITNINELLRFPELEHIFIDKAIGSKVLLPPKQFGLSPAAVMVSHPCYNICNNLLEQMISSSSMLVNSKEEIQAVSACR